GPRKPSASNSLRRHHDSSIWRAGRWHAPLARFSTESNRVLPVIPQHIAVIGDTGIPPGGYRNRRRNGPNAAVPETDDHGGGVGRIEHSRIAIPGRRRDHEGKTALRIVRNTPLRDVMVTFTVLVDGAERS